MTDISSIKPVNDDSTRHYTPTTEEVRHGWKWRDDDEFDRWLEQVKAEAWDEGRNALPVYGEDHDVYCSEYECHCDSYTNPYREETE